MRKFIVPLVMVALSAGVCWAQVECAVCGSLIDSLVPPPGSPSEEKKLAKEKPKPPAIKPVKPFDYVMVKYQARVLVRSGTANRYIEGNIILVTVPAQAILDSPEYKSREDETKSKIADEYGSRIPIRGKHPIKGHFWINPLDLGSNFP